MVAASDEKIAQDAGIHVNELLILRFTSGEPPGAEAKSGSVLRVAEITPWQAVILEELTREYLFERVLLRGLQRHDGERVMKIAADITPPVGLVDTVNAQTEGNPLFVPMFVKQTARVFIQQEGGGATGRSTKACKSIVNCRSWARLKSE